MQPSLPHPNNEEVFWDEYDITKLM